MITVFQIWKGNVKDITKQEAEDLKKFGRFDPDIIEDEMARDEVVQFLMEQDNPDAFTVEEHKEENGEFIDGGDLDSGANFLKRFRSIVIRRSVGVSRAEFCKKYNIPIRTVEDWDWGKKIPSEWVLDLLERVVREDFQSNI